MTAPLLPPADPPRSWSWSPWGLSLLCLLEVPPEERLVANDLFSPASSEVAVQPA
eukprot:CAMPEP_0175994632 /NCGR_PEP_ID=MMETSP0108-20121206/54696_1 /TAXON_ID=195067 ORGANISM="Goniomonas pacifica, Strain CCMP1869" /NCGR_SAMPLE_ID=MMETSP0108 /ASSEMBLY_ACC=CAM_ASM_000204 /LENGTH=54 /DNA_ID=CAMNT_0017326689 /DNA_START=205 /DNA_END=369 /DNA_ORIENTATION=+